MKMLYQVFVTGALLLTSCKQENASEQSTRTITSQQVGQPDTAVSYNQRKVSSNTSAIDTLHVISDKLIEQLFKSLDYQKLWPDLKLATKKFELTPGSDVPPVTDSLITYSINRNSFTYLKSGSREAGADESAGISSCHVTAAPTHLPHSIYLGMSKSALARVLGRPPFAADVVLVTEQEGYQRLHFTFKNGLLRTINFESFYNG